MYAAHTGQDACVRILLEWNADTRKRNEVGDTALMLATKRKHLGCVELLKGAQSATKVCTAAVWPHFPTNTTITTQPPRSPLHDHRR